MKKIVVFRHGQTDWNKKGLVQGVSDIPLNEDGIKQAQLLAQKLKPLKISHIFSSDQKRAVQTAGIVASLSKCKVTTNPGLREQNYGVAEGKAVGAVKLKYAEYFSVIDDPSHEKSNLISFPEGETRYEVFNRAAGLLKTLLSPRPDNDTVGVSTHGGVILSLMLVRFNQNTHLKTGEHLTLFYEGHDFVDYELGS